MIRDIPEIAAPVSGSVSEAISAGSAAPPNVSDADIHEAFSRRPSPIYSYVRSRQLEQSLLADRSVGVWGVTACRVLKGWGSVEERDWPYPQAGDPWPPVEPSGLDMRAKQHRTLGYYRARSVEDCVKLLDADQPIVACFQIDDSWKCPNSGVIPLPHGPPNGAHAVCLCGYGNADRVFKFANSWGGGWGDNGCGYLPYEYFQNRFIEGWVSLGKSHPPHDFTGAHSVIGASAEARTALGMLHTLEVVDADQNELIGWAMMIERDGFLDVEDLFVRPAWRRKGFGTSIAEHVKRHAANLGAPLRMWISHADVRALNAGMCAPILHLLGLRVDRSGVSWAAAVAVPQ